MKFTELDLQPELLKGLEKKGYVDLTPVQEQTFPYILSNRDIIARAETGSGKTAACAVPIVQKTDPNLNAIQTLILVPTRELALQYVGEISDLAKYTKLQPFAVYGGFDMSIQKAKLNHGVHILVATPGRLIDMLYNTSLSLGQVRTFVLDEADEMLDQGFLEDVEFVLSCLVHEHQILLFSATMPDAIKQLAQKHLNDPLMIELNVKKVAPQNLKHHFKVVNPRHRLDDLKAYLDEQQPRQAIIFCNSRRNVEHLFSELKGHVKGLEIIHGGQDQNKRTSLFRRFRRMDIKVMIATDVAGRGLDFEHASHVINYDFPVNNEAYTHRTGRTARMGREGAAMTFITRRNFRALKRLLQTNQIKPVFDGETPDFEEISTSKGRGRGGHSQSRSKTSGSSRGQGLAPQQSEGTPQKKRRRRRPKKRSSDSAKST